MYLKEKTKHKLNLYLLCLSKKLIFG